MFFDSRYGVLKHGMLHRAVTAFTVLSIAAPSGLRGACAAGAAGAAPTLAVSASPAS
ncbi:MAG: hypothetical protein IPJ04_17480 [Candidatus Eisenbacteria bacterium]|nr:hypothetical protein [Candidatus Eisenbacteria bacterium]